MQAAADAPNGAIPRVFVGDTFDIFNDVLDQVIERKESAENIYIVASQRSCRDGIAGLSTLVYLFEEEKIKYIQHYKLGGSSHLGGTNKPTKKGFVNLFTVHGTKGKEADVVIVLQFNEKIFSRK